MRALAVVVVLFANSRGCADSGPEPKSAVSAASVVPSGSGSAVPTTPAASVGSTPRASNTVLSESRADGCDVVIVALLDAGVYRGSPPSPMKYESYRQNPEYAGLARGIDHGAHYLSCTYRVRINGTSYRYRRAAHGGPSSEDLEPNLCNERAEAEAAAKAIATFTRACSDLHGGEYYGDVLEPDAATLGSP